MLPLGFNYLGALLQLSGPPSYIMSMIRGHAKPNLVSWIIWMLGPFLGAFFQFKAGAGLSALPVFMAGFGPLLIILFAIFIKNGYWKISIFDMFCGLLAFFALIIYFFTHNLGISILFAILADALAGIPTIVKAWKFPETESAWLYFCAAMSNFIGLLTITVWSFTVSSFGIYLVVQCTFILFCIYRKNIFGVKTIS